MRRVLATTLLSVLVLTGCSETADVVEEATQQAEEAVETVQYCSAAIRLADAVQSEDWANAIDAGEDMVETAPDEIAAEAQTVLEGARRLSQGEMEVAEDPEFQQAAQAVQEFTRDRCDPTS